jgi:hypothetical protein
MAIDALSSVPLGRSDTGEAVVLGKGNFEDFTRDILKIRQKEGEEAKQTNAEIGKLLQDQVQSKWAKDNIDIFQPKMQAIKDKTLELYKEKKGKLNSVDLYGIQSEWNKLKAEAEASNSLYAENEKAIQQLREDPKGEKFDIEQSSLIRQKFADPMSDPELAKEVINQYGGDVIKWRANNAGRFANVASYSVNDDLTKGFKDKLSKEYIRDAKGNIKMTEGKGGVLIGEFREGIDREKIKSHFDTFYNRTDYAGKKFRKQAEDKVNNEFTIAENGQVTPLTEEALIIFQKTPNLKNKSVAEIKSILAREVGLNQVESLFPTKEGIFTEKPMKINVSTGGGGPSTKYNWAAGSADVKNLPELTWAKTLPGRKAIEGARNYVQKLWADKVPYVTVSPTKGTETPTFRLTNIKTGKPMEVATLGFKKNKNGDWIYVSAEKQKMSDGMSMSAEQQKLEAEKKFEPIETNLMENTALATELAAAYDFGTTKELIDFLNTKAKQSGIKEKGVTRAEGAIPSTGGTPSNKPTSNNKPQFKGVPKGGKF